MHRAAAVLPGTKYSHKWYAKVQLQDDRPKVQRAPDHTATPPHHSTRASCPLPCPGGEVLCGRACSGSSSGLCIHDGAVAARSARSTVRRGCLRAGLERRPLPRRGAGRRTKGGAPTTCRSAGTQRRRSPLSPAGGRTPCGWRRAWLTGRWDLRRRGIPLTTMLASLLMRHQHRGRGAVGAQTFFGDCLHWAAHAHGCLG